MLGGGHSKPILVLLNLYSHCMPDDIQLDSGTTGFENRRFHLVKFSRHRHSKCKIAGISFVCNQIFCRLPGLRYVYYSGTKWWIQRLLKKCYIQKKLTTEKTKMISNVVLGNRNIIRITIWERNATNVVADGTSNKIVISSVLHNLSIWGINVNSWSISSPQSFSHCRH